MSARRRSRKRHSTTTTPPSSVSTQESKPTSVIATKDEEKKGTASKHLSTKGWIMIYVILFLVVEALLFLFLKGFGGEGRVRSKMLAQADEYLQAEKYEDALDVLDEFGDRWPGALATQNFQARLGRFNYTAGNYKEAARHFVRSSQANPEMWDLRAYAGRAFWQADQKVQAVKYLKEELAKGNPESDISQYYLGLYEFEQGNIVDALGHFEKIRDREEYKDRLEEIMSQIEEEYLEPVRKQVSEVVIHDSPTS